MTYVMTYDNLVDKITTYCTRVGDALFIEQIPLFIQIAENKCSRDIKTLLYKQFVVGTFASGTPIYDKPVRWRETVSMNYGSGTNNNSRNTLLPRSYEYCRMYWPDDTVTDLPLYYSDTDQYHFLACPTPNDDYPYELVYYQQPEFLSDSNQTNIITEKAPELLLYGALVEAATYLKTDDNGAKWQAAYDRVLASIRGEDAGRVEDASMRREKGV